MTDPESIKESIEDSATAGVRRGVVDGQTFETHSLPDQIEAEKHIRNAEAASKRRRGWFFGRFVPRGGHE